VTLPARKGQRTERNVRPDAASAAGRRLCAFACLLTALVVVVGMPPQAAAAAGDIESTSLLAISAVGAIGFLLFGALAFGAFTLLRRTRRATSEVRRLNALLDVLDEGVAVCSGMQAVAVNTSLCRLIGIQRDDVGHLMISSFIADADVIERVLGEDELRLDTDITNRAGDTIAVEIAARTIPHGEGTARLLEFRDVGERKHTQARVSFLAHHDPLTSLPNRELMRARLKQAVEHAAATGTAFAVLWIDLDHFKDINDIHGHVVGDQILRIVAEKLKFEMPADTLIARLGGDRDIVVRPLASVRRFGGLDQDPLSAGRELGVETVLDGSLQRAGDKIRVNARLIRTSDGSSLWSDTFDEKFTDIFAVQDRISNEIAGALKTRLGSAPAGNSSTENVEAYRLYLQGRYHALKSTPPEIRQGIDFYRQAIAADPNYALAYAGMAQAFAALPITSDVPPAEAFPQSKAAAVRALEIDPDLSEARIILGTIEFWYEWRWAEAEAELKKAIATAPNSSDAHRFYAVLLTATGRADESLAEIESARQLDPLSLIVNALKSQAYFYAGRDAEAVEQANKTLEIEPNFWIAHLMLARVFIVQNKLDEAVAEAQKAAQFSGGNSEAISLEAYALAKSERREEALAKLKELKSRSHERYVPAYNTAMIYNGLGSTDEALDQLEIALQTRDARMILLKVDPKWDNLRNESRFRDLMRKTNFD